MTLADLWEMMLNNFLGFILILCRVSGIFTFNPIFSRSNFPMRLKAGTTLVMAVLFASTMGEISYNPSGTFMLMFDVLKELGLGLVLGFMVNLILTVTIYAGEIIDTQSGLGMAKAMDPATGVSMPIFANVYYYMFILYFFITGGHLSYVKLFHISYETLPIGFSGFTADVAWAMANYLGTVLTLAVKFAAPILAVEIITEVCLGVLMKAVPSIHVFAVNIQLKVLIGFLMVLMMAQPMADFIERLMGIMWQNLYGLLGIMGG
ncbi:MAG: flagellar biosynthetic protein FliR [Ruminiclostridium sp.]|nr:flagellar biosynthetic protein FliR [Ruminiclostridium sp.]